MCTTRRLTEMLPVPSRQPWACQTQVDQKSCACTLKIRGGCDIDSRGNKAGKGPLVQWEKSGTLGVSQDQTLFVWKGMDTANRTEVTDTE